MKLLKLLIIIFILLIPRAAIAGITFDGVDDRVPLTSAKTETTSFTLSVWVQIAALPASSMRFFMNGRGGVNGWGVSVTATDGVIRFTKCAVADLDIDIGSFTLNTWHQIVVVVSSGSAVELYYDGVDKGNYGNTAAISANTNEILVGSDNDGSGIPTFFWKGKITEVYYWNAALTAGNVTTLYGGGTPTRGAGTSISASNLKIYLPMNDGTSGSANGQTVADTSGQSNNGTGNWGANASGLTWYVDSDLFPSSGHNYTISSAVLKNVTMN